MYVAKFALWYLLGALLSTPVGVAIWWHLENYDGDMPFGMVAFLQLIKVPIFAGIPVLLASIIFRVWKFRGDSKVVRMSLCAGLIWGVVWFILFSYGGPISKAMDEAFRVYFVLFLLGIAPLVISFGIPVLAIKVYRKIQNAP